MSPPSTLYLLMGTAVSTALFHTLIPDHWLPFVLLGRARGWSGRATAAVSGLSAAIHALLSVGLGVATLAAGIGVARTVGETLEESAAVLLVVFGLVYAAWAWRKGGHFHPGGRLLHSRDEGPACGGSEGVSPEHLHYHADEKLIRGSRHRGPVALAVIVGINPCILILPIVFGTAQHGAGAVAAVLAAYSATTVALMVGLSVMGVLGTRRLRLPAGARYMETASGLVIAVTGVLFWLLGHS